MPALAVMPALGRLDGEFKTDLSYIVSWKPALAL
jgi:hypothetical protein